MKRALAFAVLAWSILLCILLQTPIKDWLWSHPWWHSFLVALPAIAAAVIALLDLRHSGEANELRRQNNELREALDSERNQHLQQIAVNTQRSLTEAERNAQILRKHIGKRAFVSEGGNNWGAMGAIIAEVNENNILTLFCPAGTQTAHAYGQAVRCDKLHIVEVPRGGCAVEVSIIERYGTTTYYGEARSWDERHIQQRHVGMQRGQNAFTAQYRKDGSSKLRQIHIYGPPEGSNDYTMVAIDDQKETGSWYSSKLDIEKKFAVVQVEWADEGYRYDGGGGSGTLNLFTRK